MSKMIKIVGLILLMLPIGPARSKASHPKTLSTTAPRFRCEQLLRAIRDSDEIFFGLEDLIHPEFNELQQLKVLRHAISKYPGHLIPELTHGKSGEITQENVREQLAAVSHQFPDLIHPESVRFVWDRTPTTNAGIQLLPHFFYFPKKMRSKFQDSFDFAASLLGLDFSEVETRHLGEDWISRFYVIAAEAYLRLGRPAFLQSSHADSALKVPEALSFRIYKDLFISTLAHWVQTIDRQTWKNDPRRLYLLERGLDLDELWRLRSLPNQPPRKVPVIP